MSSHRFRSAHLALFLALTVLHLLAAEALVASLIRARGIDTATTLLLLGPAIVSFAMFEARWLTLPVMRVPTFRPPPPGLRVGMATTFVPDAEPFAMLEVTVRSMVDVDCPHDTWVLDEGGEDRVRELCGRTGAHYFTRAGEPRYQTPAGRFAARTKHGNYNAWLDAVALGRYEVIVNVDPDHVLDRAFLVRTLGHLDDDGVAYVQAAQAYYNQAASFVARGAAEETYAYYSSVQMASYGMGYPIATGCHTVHRAQALRAIGGYPPHDADDLLSTIVYRAAGWRGVYVPEILARGMTPVDWTGYLKQQLRWARSVLDIKLRLLPRLAKHLPLRERVVSILHGASYVNGLMTAMSVTTLVVALLAGAFGDALLGDVLVRALFLIAALGACEMFRQLFFLDFRREWGLHWRSAFLRFAKWPFILRALLEVVARRPDGYQITAKMPSPGRRRMASVPHLVVGGVVSAAWIGAVAYGRRPVAFLQVLAAVHVALSVLVVVSERFDFPDPYDPELLPEWVRSGPVGPGGA